MRNFHCLSAQCVNKMRTARGCLSIDHRALNNTEDVLAWVSDQSHVRPALFLMMRVMSPLCQFDRCECEYQSGRIGGNVDLLKLDCEGAEWQILQDVDTMRHVRSVRMEYHKNGGHTLDELLGLARDAGFDASHVQDRDRFGIAWLQRSADSLSSARP
jgi:hypothetical protein